MIMTRKASLQLKKNMRHVEDTHARHDMCSLMVISEERKKAEKEKRETALYFVSEIERCNAQIERLSKTGSLGDAATCLYYKRIIAEKILQMETKFSKEEIEKAKQEYAKDPKWSYLLKEQNQR